MALFASPDPTLPFAAGTRHTRARLVLIVRSPRTKEVGAVTHAVFAISRTSEGWVIRHDSEISPPYEGAESAFEAACAAAASAVKLGVDTTVTVDHGRSADNDAGRSALGETIFGADKGPTLWR